MSSYFPFWRNIAYFVNLPDGTAPNQQCYIKVNYLKPIEAYVHGNRDFKLLIINKQNKLFYWLWR